MIYYLYFKPSSAWEEEGCYVAVRNGYVGLFAEVAAMEVEEL